MPSTGGDAAAEKQASIGAVERHTGQRCPTEGGRLHMAEHFARVAMHDGDTRRRRVRTARALYGYDAHADRLLRHQEDRGHQGLVGSG